MQMRIAATLVMITLVAIALCPQKARAQAGVRISPAGVLSTHTFADPSGRIHLARIEAAKAALAPEIAKPSKLRKISLNRLEAAVATLRANGEKPSHEMLHLAGLTRITNVFFFPDSGDIVIAGPAEGYARDATGRAVGVITGASVLELEDMVAALRAFPASGEQTDLISVSIDPTPEGLARLQAFLKSVAGRLSPGDSGRLVAGMKEALGLQHVTIRGVSPKTHFAQVLVEADYRMKLIGIGLERPGVDIPSYVDKAPPGHIAANAMQRWVFVPNYDKVMVSEDRLSMQLVGDGVKLVGENQVVRENGERVVSGKVDGVAAAFTAAFTAKYPKLAKAEPVYAQMRNMIDMSIVAAYIHQQDFYAQSGWEMKLFGDEEKFPIEVHNEPKTVHTAVNAIWKGRTLMTPIGGGVNIQPRVALSKSHLLKDDGAATKARETITLDNLGPTEWWWD